MSNLNNSDHLSKINLTPDSSVKLTESTKKTPKILFFDSGVGGLSILNAVENVFFNKFEYSYLFDNELFPYSEKPDHLLRKKIVPLLTKIVQEQQFDYLVIACNTASTLILDDLRKELVIPVIGTIPAIKPAVDYLIKTKQVDKCVGIVATKATIARPYTLKLIDDFAQAINKNVSLLGTTDLVELVEHHVRCQEYNGPSLQQIFAPWLISEDLNLGAIVLACTHFSLIKDQIQTLFPNVILIDACYAIARRIGYLEHIFTAEDIEQQRKEFVAYLHNIKQNPQAYQSHKHLISTKALNDKDLLPFKDLGFIDYKVISYES